MSELLHLKTGHTDAKLVVGNSELGIETRFKNAKYPMYIAVSHIPELNVHLMMDSGIQVGASIPLTRVRDLLLEHIKKYPVTKVGIQPFHFHRIH